MNPGDEVHLPLHQITDQIGPLGTDEVQYPIHGRHFGFQKHIHGPAQITEQTDILTAYQQDGIGMQRGKAGKIILQ